MFEGRESAMRVSLYVVIGVVLVVSAIPIFAPGTVSAATQQAPPAGSSSLSGAPGNNDTALVWFSMNGTGLSSADKVEFAFTGTHITQKTTNKWYFKINESYEEYLWFLPNQNMNFTITSNSLPILYVNMSAKSSIEMNSTLFHGDVKEVTFSIPIINTSDPNGDQVPAGGTANTSIIVTIGHYSPSTNSTGTGNTTTPPVKLYTVTVDETGLPSGTTWGVGEEVSGGGAVLLQYTNDTSISAGMSNGTHTLLIAVVSLPGRSTGNYSANTPKITFTIDGAGVVFHIKFTKQTDSGLLHLDIGIVLLVIGSAAAALALKSKRRTKRKEGEPEIGEDIIHGQSQGQEHAKDGASGRPQPDQEDQPDQPQEPGEGEGEDMEREETDEFSRIIRGEK